MGAMGSQITSLTIIYSIVHSGADQKETSTIRATGLQAFVHQWPVARKMVDFLIGHYTYRIFPPAIDIIPTLLAVVYSNGKYTN